MNNRNFFLSPKMGNDLLLAASREKVNTEILVFTFSNYHIFSSSIVFLFMLTLPYIILLDWWVYGCQLSMGYDASSQS